MPGATFATHNSGFNLFSHDKSGNVYVNTFPDICQDNLGHAVRQEFLENFDYSVGDRNYFQAIKLRVRAVKIFPRF